MHNSKVRQPDPIQSDRARRGEAASPRKSPSAALKSARFSSSAERNCVMTGSMGKRRGRMLVEESVMAKGPHKTDDLHCFDRTVCDRN